MATRRGIDRIEPLALAAALVAPLPMLALAPGALRAVITVLVVAMPFAAFWALFRFLRRGARPPLRPSLLPPPLGPLPAEAAAGTFLVRRRGRVVVRGIWDVVLAAARAGRIRPSDEVSGGGDVSVAPADLADLVPLVPSRAEARLRRGYLAYLAVSLGAGAAGIAILTAARAERAPLPDDTAVVVLVLWAALLVLLPLRSGWRRLAAGRAAGLVPEPPPRRTLGSESLDAALAGPTPATRATLVLVVAVSGLALLLPEDDLLGRLAKDNDAIRAGEWWRVLTAGLVHGGAIHLLLNGSVLSSLGGFVERLVGARRKLAVLWGGVLAGSLASVATNPHPSVGISGGLFALVGAVLAVGLRHRRTLPPPARRMLVRAPVEVIVLNLALGLALPIIDNAAHLGGLAGGVLLGLALGLRPEVRAALSAPSARGE
jgi:membrane associated rhomboid family serine protease